MILSGNAEVAFPPTTTPASNFPTPVTAIAAASTTNEADIATSVMSTLTTTATGSLPIAAAAATSATRLVPKIATHSASQKRKARP
jgi:hypothetical protein